MLPRLLLLVAITFSSPALFAAAQPKTCWQNDLNLGLGQMQMSTETGGSARVLVESLGSHEYTRCFKSPIGDLMTGYGIELEHAHGSMVKHAFNLTTAFFSYGVCAVSEEGFRLCGDIGPEAGDYDYNGDHYSLGSIVYAMSLMKAIGAGFGLGVSFEMLDFRNPAADWKELNGLALKFNLAWAWTSSR